MIEFVGQSGPADQFSSSVIGQMLPCNLNCVRSRLWPCQSVFHFVCFRVDVCMALKVTNQPLSL